MKLFAPPGRGEVKIALKGAQAQQEVSDQCGSSCATTQGNSE